MINAESHMEFFIFFVWVKKKKLKTNQTRTARVSRTRKQFKNPPNSNFYFGFPVTDFFFLWVLPPKNVTKNPFHSPNNRAMRFGQILYPKTIDVVTWLLF